MRLAGNMVCAYIATNISGQARPNYTLEHRLMATNAASELSRLVSQLIVERKQHADALAQIDATFASLGISPKPRRGRRPAAFAAAAASAAAPAAKGPGKRRRRRGKFEQTGEQYILSLLDGGKKLSTAEVNKQWIASGRKGRADIALGKMVKENKIKRHKVKDVRGSMYTA